MGNTRGTSRTRSSADTGFVREKTSLDTKHDRRPRKSAENCFHIKRVAEDLCEHSWKKCDMGHDHEHGNRNVEESHERNDLFRDPCDLFSTAADADEE